MKNIRLIFSILNKSNVLLYNRKIQYINMTSFVMIKTSKKVARNFLQYAMSYV